MHYRRKLRTGEVGQALPLKITKYHRNEPCSIDGCVRLVAARDLCLMHFKRVQRHGSPGSAEPMPRVNRNGIDSEGYRRIRVAGRKVKEHRHVMELKIGRSLLPGENVHHLNGVRHDNRPENLELWVTAQTCGQRAGDQLDWALQIVARYQPLRDASLI